MAKALSKYVIQLDKRLAGDPARYAKPLHDYLKKYKAEFYRDSSADHGHVYWSAPVKMWMLSVKKGHTATVTFYAPDDCPCKMLAK